MARNTGSLLVVALAACAIYFLLPAAETFLAPQAPRGSSMPGSEANTLAQGSAYQAEARSSRVIVKATGDPPQKINLLFLGLLAGTAALGLLAVFAYGSYSGAGSGL
ncbi:unnamed protein product [Polarella glacialis]|uniref:Photosystem II reaction center protein J n=1 Tax=Polarella glacialis TaxID=89957 RepID=A0A813KPU1_POLGL|nr:unnamed protein product [Polarella glacialis]CAE8709872.1 unnamed protein product [Polarella glacialis]